MSTVLLLPTGLPRREGEETWDIPLEHQEIIRWKRWNFHDDCTKSYQSFKSTNVFPGITPQSVVTVVSDAPSTIHLSQQLTASYSLWEWSPASL